MELIMEKIFFRGLSVFLNYFTEVLFLNCVPLFPVANTLPAHMNAL